MKWYQGTAFFLSVSKRHILPLIHHGHSSVWGTFESKSTRGRQLFTLKNNFLFGWGKKKNNKQKRKKRVRNKATYNFSPRGLTDLGMKNFKWITDALWWRMLWRRKKKKKINKQEWASMEDWLVVKSSICCCERRRRITRATSYSVLLGTYWILTSWGHEDIFPTGHTLVMDVYTWISLDFHAFVQKREFHKGIEYICSF